jgi:hypothetical protein
MKMPERKDPLHELAIWLALTLLCMITAALATGCTSTSSMDIKEGQFGWNVILDPAWLTYTRQDKDPNGASTTIIYTPSTKPAPNATAPLP